MARVEPPGGGASFCIDRWEGALVDGGGGLHAYFRQPDDDVAWKAVSRAGIRPQAHVTQEQATAACRRAGKRLCTDEEWVTACRGPVPTRYPYGDRHRDGHCHDAGVSPLRLLHRSGYQHDHNTLNDPRLNKVAGTLARTGEYARCTNGYGVHDMVGNLHEWTSYRADEDSTRRPSTIVKGHFRGGYYLDTTLLGEGCGYVTGGHGVKYRDYSTGFRCCQDG